LLRPASRVAISSIISRGAARSTLPKSSGTPWRPARCADARYAVARALRRRAREKREDPPDQLLVVLEVVAEDPELFEVDDVRRARSEEHTSELQSRGHLVCRLLLEKKKKKTYDKR